MLIIACGNLDRADDAAGILVAECLHDLGIDARVCSGETSDLMEAWSTDDDVIVVDCVVSGAPTGTVHEWEASRRFTFQSPGSTHGLGLREAIELARAIGCLPRRLRIYGIEGKNFEVGAPVSAEVNRGVTQVVNQIATERQRH